MRDGHADDALELPLSTEFVMSSGLVAGQHPTFILLRTTKRLDDEWRQDLSAAEGGVDPLAREGIEEVGGVTDQSRSGSPGGPRYRGKRARRPDRRDTLGAHKSFGEVGTRRYPLLEEFRAALSNLARTRHWDDDGHIHQAAPHVDDSEIATVVDVHLSKRPYVPDVLVVRGKRDSLGKESAGVGQTKSPADNRAKSVGANDVPAPQSSRASVRPDDTHSTDPTRVIPGEVGHSNQLFDARAGRSGSVEDYRIENDSPHGEAVVAEPAKSVIRCKLAIRGLSVRRAHPHARQMGGARALYLVEDIHIGENTRRLRAQVLGAGLVPRKLRSVEHEDIYACSRQRVGRARSGRTSANDYDLSVESWTHSLSDRARNALEKPHVLPVRARQVKN